MEADAVHVPHKPSALTRLAKLTPEERARCIAEGHRFKCREVGHITKTFPKKDASAAAPAVAYAAATVNIKQVPSIKLAHPLNQDKKRHFTFLLPEREPPHPKSTKFFKPLEVPDPENPPLNQPEMPRYLPNLELPYPEEALALDLMSTLYKKDCSELLAIPVDVNGTVLTAMIDSKQVAKMFRNVIYDRESSVAIRLVSGEIVRCVKSMQDAVVTYENGSISVEDLIVAPIKYDLILGIPWIHDTNTFIEWRKIVLTPASSVSSSKSRSPTSVLPATSISTESLRARLWKCFHSPHEERTI